MSEPKKPKAEKAPDRGTQNEMEVIKLILDANPVLKKRVLDRLRVGKASYMAKEQRKTAGKE